MKQKLSSGLHLEQLVYSGGTALLCIFIRYESFTSRCCQKFCPLSALSSIHAGLPSQIPHLCSRCLPWELHDYTWLSQKENNCLTPEAAQSDKLATSMGGEETEKRQQTEKRQRVVENCIYCRIRVLGKTGNEETRMNTIRIQSVIYLM